MKKEEKRAKIASRLHLLCTLWPPWALFTYTDGATGSSYGPKPARPVGPEKAWPSLYWTSHQSCLLNYVLSLLMPFGGETIETGVNNARPLLDESKLCQTSAQEVSRHKNQLPKSQFSDFNMSWQMLFLVRLS